MKQGTQRRVERVELAVTRIIEGKRPAVWIVDPECEPKPDEGWVRSLDDVPTSDDRGRLILLVKDGNR